nr:putative disease resistance protein [Quercus suber]
MADAVVTFLLQNLTQLLSQESNLLAGVEDQVKLLKNELSLVNVFLQNTEGKRHDSGLVKELVNQIRDVAYEAEDVIDTFILTMTKHRKRSKPRKVIHFFDRAIALHEVAHKIESIKNLIKETYNNRSKYGIEIAESSGGEAEAVEILHRRRIYVEEDHVVGFGHDTEALVKQLIEGNLQHNVVSIIGMGGLVSAEEKFLEVRSNVNLSPISKSRRISIHSANHPDISSNPCEPSNSRSFIGFGEVVKLESPLDKSNYLKWLCETNKLVRVVELSNMGICCLIPNKIENLILLRYLSIQSGELHVIPDSICSLWNLETLDLRNSERTNYKIKCLPKGIWKLQKLRHLYLDGPTSLPRTDNTVTLPNLQVLTGIAINEDIESLFAKARFPNVRKLELHSIRWTESGLFSSLHPLLHLQTLKIYELFFLSSPTSFHLTLTKITIFVGANLFGGGVMRVLGSLTNLRILKVVGDGHHQITLDCDESSFCQLEVFKMAKMQVVHCSMGKGEMPRLQRLIIECCDFFFMPPEELRWLTAFWNVEVLYPGPTLAKMVQQLQNHMRDGCKLQVYPPLDPTYRES